MRQDRKSGYPNNRPNKTSRSESDMMATSSDPFLPAEIPEQFNIAEYFLDAPAGRHPAKAAIVGEPCSITYADLAALANRAGNALQELGVSRADRVLIVLPDSAEFMASFFGAARIGAVAVPVNPYARSADYIHYIEDSEPRVAIVHFETLEAFLPASSERPQMPIVVVGEGQVETHGVSCASWGDWIASASHSLALANTSSGDSAFMLYTSGSGGTPKAAVHCHRDMLVATRNYAQGVLGLRADDVTFSVSAGETLPAEIFERWRRATGLEILDGIGSTEMLHIFISSRPGQCKPGSCGFPVPGYEAKIVDDAGNEVPDGEIGNLWVRGASAFAEYWRIPELTARTKRGDWVVTGDKFVRDSGGYYHYCGRADDMLKVAGMWVSPVEVENALLGHPHVAEAAVVGATDVRGLTYAVAYVVLRAGCEGSDELAAEIRSHVKARLVSHKVPREVRFCGEVPKTVTGKIQRFKLRASTTHG